MQIQFGDRHTVTLTCIFALMLSTQANKEIKVLKT